MRTAAAVLAVLAAIATIATFLLQFNIVPHPFVNDGDPQLSLSRGSGPLGTRVTVSGSG